MPFSLSRQLFTSFFILALVGLAGCATLNDPVTSSHDPEADFTKYKTFSVEPVQSNDQYVYVHHMIKDSIIRNLSSKGMTPAGVATNDVPAEADVKIRFTTEVEDVPAVDIEYVPTDYGLWTRYLSGQVTEGRLLVNVVDSQSGNVVWKAVTSGQVDRSREARQEAIDRVVDDLFKSFPPPRNDSR